MKFLVYLIGAPIALVILYFSIRLGTAAFFQSYHEFLGKKGKQNEP